MTRLQRIGIALVLAGSVAAVLWAARFDPEVPFLSRDAQAPWIAPPMPLDTGLRRVRDGEAHSARFERRFELGSDSEAALSVRALGALDVRIDGESVLEAAAGECLKRRCRARHPLGAGPHALVARVANERGPPLLSLALEAAGSEGTPGPVRIDTRSGFRVRGGERGTPLAAAFADDTRRLPEALHAQRPGDAAARLWPWLLLFAALGAAAAPLARRFAALAPSPALRTRVLFAALALLWLWLFAARFSQLPLETGFDAFGHVEYAHYIASHGTLPARDHGWSTYHPPAFYALAALPLRLVTGGGDAAAAAPADEPRARLALRFVPWLCALANVWIVWRMGRLLYRDDERIALAAALFAGLLPLQITMAAYISNEATHAAFASASLLAAALAMTTREPARALPALVAAALALGLALLSKFTALLFVPVVSAFVAFERWQARGWPLPRALATGVGLAAAAFALGGWFYVQNALTTGDPVVWNLDFPGADSWWVHPAFHTLRYFTSAGDAFTLPFFSSFHSFWDGLYTTLWGDGQIGGFTRWAGRPTLWNWDWMALTYWLAAPLTLMTALGAGLLVRDSFTGDDRSRRAVFAMLTTLGFALAVSVVGAVLRYPFFGTARASYAMAVLVPLSLAAARGGVATWSATERLSDSGRAVTRAFLRGWLACTIAAVLLTYAV